MQLKGDKKEAIKIPKKVFDEDEILAKLHKVDDEELGTIEFGDLSYDDLMELENLGVDDNMERSKHIYLLMRQKAKPTLTLEKVAKMPAVTLIRVLDKMTEASGFLEVIEKQKAKMEQAKKKEAEHSTFTAEDLDR